MLDDKQNTTPVFRIENPNINNPPDGIIWHEELRGQWFSSDIENTKGYIHQVTYDRSPYFSTVDEINYVKDTPVVNGARLVIAYVISNHLESYRAAYHPIASKLSFMGNDYIIPRDGTIPITEISIDRLLGRLRFNLFKGNNEERAQARIRRLAQVAVLLSNAKIVK
jgi:hypothetical protein